MSSSLRKRRASRRVFYYRYQGGHCYLCPREMTLTGFVYGDTYATWDHVLPRAAGGRTMHNVLLACNACNGSKGDSPGTPAQMKAAHAAWEAWAGYAGAEPSYLKNIPVEKAKPPPREPKIPSWSLAAAERRRETGEPEPSEKARSKPAAPVRATVVVGLPKSMKNKINAKVSKSLADYRASFPDTQKRKRR